MNTLAEHYALLLGLDESWQVTEADLSLKEQRIQIHLQATEKSPRCCPQCGEQRQLKDHAPERSWRHLDTMQFETILSWFRHRISNGPAEGFNSRIQSIKSVHPLIGGRRSMRPLPENGL